MKRLLNAFALIGTVAAFPQISRADFIEGNCAALPNVNAAPQRVFLVNPESPNTECTPLPNNPIPTYRVNNMEKALTCADQAGDEIRLESWRTPSDPVLKFPRFTVSGKSKGTPAHPLVIRPVNPDLVVVDAQGVIDDDQGVIDVQSSSNVVIKDLKITNSSNQTIPPQSQTEAERGISVRDGTNIALVGNTITNIGRHGIAMDGTNLLVRGNKVSHVATYKWNKTGGAAWDGGLSASMIYPTTCARWESNTVSDVYGEGLDVLRVDNALVINNAISDAWSVNLYVDGSRNVTVDRNYIFSTPSGRKQHDTEFGDVNAVGIMLAREIQKAGQTPPYPLGDVRISNNIIDTVSQGIRYWGDDHDGQHPQSWFYSLRIMYNTILNAQINGIKIDTPKLEPTGTNRIQNNIVKRGPVIPQGKDVYIAGYQGSWETSYNLFATQAPPYSAQPSSNVNWNENPQLQPTIGQSCSYRLALATNRTAATQRATWTLVTTDFWALSRPASPTKPSIGADEYRATNPYCP